MAVATKPYRVRPPFRWKGDRSKSMTGREHWSKRHEDGTIEVWLVEETSQAHRAPTYDLTQFFYEPGDQFHNNGRFLSDCRSYAPYAAKLKALGFKRSKLVTS